MRVRSVDTGNPANRQTMVTALADAVELCKRRGVQLTSARRRLLEILWEHPSRPQGAYPLMRRIEVITGKQTTATSVYRALEFLLEQGLVMRIESRNAYLPSPHPGRPYMGAFLLCDVCGDATGMNDTAVERLLAEQAKSSGFIVRGTMIELLGVCNRCRHRGVAG